ncbi:MAG: hypothetical protein ACLGI3_04915, partial [Actinomycetes bacterium]
VAAKTGTSNDYADAWLVGYSPQLVAATWVGYPAGALPMHDVSDVSRVTGGSIPAGIWRDVMSIAHEGLEPASFPAPDGPPVEQAGDQETVPTVPPPPPTTSRPTTTQPEATSATKATTTSTTTTTTRPPSTTTTRPPATTTTEPRATTTTVRASTTTTKPGKAQSRAPAAERRSAAG